MAKFYNSQRFVLLKQIEPSQIQTIYLYNYFLCHIQNLLGTWETRSIATWEESSAFSSITCVTGWTWTTSRSFRCVCAFNSYKARRELAQRSCTISSIAGITCWTGSTLRTIHRHVTRNSYSKLQSINFPSDWNTSNFTNWPGKQRKSLQVMIRSQDRPSPEYPLGQGPHLGPSGLSKHVTPEK